MLTYSISNYDSSELKALSSAAAGVRTGIPSPCVDQFNPPIYQFSNFTTSVSWNLGTSMDMSFTISDTANNYSLQCHGTYNPMADDTYYSEDDCVPEDGQPLTDYHTQVMLHVHTFRVKNEWDPQGPIRIDQHWYCDGKNNSYPSVVFLLHTLSSNCISSCLQE
jgi:hypothetical protein